jgi:uncharacterized protein
MKRCPKCNRTYADDTFSFCLADGALLSAPYNPATTLVLPETASPDPAATVSIDEPVVVININQQYKHVENAEDLYNCTRGIWRLNRKRAGKAQYAFAVYQGVIKEVYEIDKWIPVSQATRDYWKERENSQGRYFPPEIHDGRSEFTGKLAPETIRKKYVGRRMPVRLGQNPIRYFNC